MSLYCASRKMVKPTVEAKMKLVRLFLRLCALRFARTRAWVLGGSQGRRRKSISLRRD